MLHRGERRTPTTEAVRETEAEAVSFVVCQAIGLENSSSAADYVTVKFMGRKPPIMGGMAVFSEKRRSHNLSQAVCCECDKWCEVSARLPKGRSPASPNCTALSGFS